MATTAASEATVAAAVAAEAALEATWATLAALVLAVLKAAWALVRAASASDLSASKPLKMVVSMSKRAVWFIAPIGVCKAKARVALPLAKTAALTL